MRDAQSNSSGYGVQRVGRALFASRVASLSCFRMTRCLNLKLRRPARPMLPRRTRRSEQAIALAVSRKITPMTPSQRIRSTAESSVLAMRWKLSRRGHPPTMIPSRCAFFITRASNEILTLITQAILGQVNAVLLDCRIALFEREQLRLSVDARSALVEAVENEKRLLNRLVEVKQQLIQESEESGRLKIEALTACRNCLEAETEKASGVLSCLWTTIADRGT